MNPPNPNFIHSDFHLNGVPYDVDGLSVIAYDFIKKGPAFKKELGFFILDWLNADSTILLQTSGTTATPKKLSFQKKALVHSAKMTGTYFNLLAGQQVLHCLPAKYIAGKMMLLRALILGLHLDVVAPSSKPLQGSKIEYDFVAMTPFQAMHSLDDLVRVKTLIIGGSSVATPLKKALITKRINAYETYGMTETLSHIAVRKMDAPTAEFKQLPNITIRQDQRNCLVVDAPELGVHDLVTNDKIERINSTTFRLIGRIDNVINSGGVKLHPEPIEHKLANHLEYPFFVGGISDKKLGECLVLAIASSFSKRELIITALKSVELQPYEFPKKILFYDTFLKTPTGKIQRKATLKSPFAASLDLK